MLMATAMMPPVSADELIASDWGWWTPSGYEACGKTSIHYGTPLTRGRAYSWLTDEEDDCDATKVNAYSQVISYPMYYDEGEDDWFPCGGMDQTDWETVTYRVIVVEGYSCGATDFYATVSSFGTCVGGECRHTDDVCPLTTSTWPPSDGWVYGPTCYPQDLYPLASPSHAG
jgi:hypothetical protein